MEMEIFYIDRIQENNGWKTVIGYVIDDTVLKLKLYLRIEIPKDDSSTAAIKDYLNATLNDNGRGIESGNIILTEIFEI